MAEREAAHGMPVDAHLRAAQDIDVVEDRAGDALQMDRCVAAQVLSQSEASARAVGIGRIGAVGGGGAGQVHVAE